MILGGDCISVNVFGSGIRFGYCVFFEGLVLFIVELLIKLIVFFCIFLVFFIRGFCKIFFIFYKLMF